MTVTNVVLFQAGWFACVLSAAYGAPWVGVVAVAAIVVWHVSRAGRPRLELALAAVCGFVGVVFETVLTRTEWINYDAGQPWPGFAPYWMVSLWVLFATTLNVSLRSLRTRLRLAAVLGAVGGPIAYYGGARAGALELAALGPALIAIALGWALLTPLLMATARRLDGYPAR